MPDTDYDSLPFYESKATPEERQEALELMGKQVKLLLDQERINVPLTHVKVRCGCLKMVRLIQAHRCLYCGIFFCQRCAELHFGKRVAARANNTELSSSVAVLANEKL